MWLTTSFLDIQRGETEHLFFLLTDGYIEDNATIAASLEPLLQKFARDLGASGAVVRAFPPDVEQAKNSVLAKNWAAGQRTQIRKSPGLLILDVDFAQFDPQRDQWLHISLRDAMDRHGHVEIFELEEFFSQLAQACRDDDGVFEVVKRNARRQALREVAASVDIRPGAFGVSFDVKRGFIRPLLRLFATSRSSS